MARSREFRRTTRVGTAAGLILFAGLLIGAAPAAAAPPPPTGVAVPVMPPLPPKPCAKNVICHTPTLDPCFSTDVKDCQPTKTLTPPTLEPCFTTKTEDCQPTTTPSVPTSEPSSPATPTTPPKAIPTPNRTDTGGGVAAAGVEPAAAASPATTSWVLWAVPAGALVILVAGLAGAWLARSEQRDRRP